MVYAFELLKYFSPLLVLPISFIMIFVFVYYVYEKYQIRIRIRNVPHYTIFPVDLDKTKRNLEIKSMQYTFILILITLEIIAIIFWGITQFEKCDSKFISKGSIEIQCFSSKNQTLWVHVTRNFVIIPMSLLIPTTCLFLIVLRRVFINLPYKRWIRGYILYILLRVIAMSLLSLSLETIYILHLTYLPLTLIDIGVYISVSRAFYVLLRGRRFEARLHSTGPDYLEKKKIERKFFRAQIYTYFGLFFIFLHFSSLFFDNAIEIIYNPTFFESISLGYLPKVLIPWSTAAHKISHFFYIIQGASATLLQIYLFLTYIFVSMHIFSNICNRRRKFKHVNYWITRPLMEKYRSNLDRRRTQERPPFIQAFRSHFVY